MNYSKLHLSVDHIPVATDYQEMHPYCLMNIDTTEFSVPAILLLIGIASPTIFAIS